MGSSGIAESDLPAAGVLRPTAPVRWVALESLKATCPPSMGSLEVIRSDKDFKQLEVKVTPQKTLPVGFFRFDVMLEPNGVNVRYPVVRFPVEGIVLPDVQAFPDSLVLGERRIGETVSEKVTLRSASDTPFEVFETELDSSDMLVERTEVPGIEGTVYNVVQRITKVGKQVSLARFSIRSNTGARSVLVVKTTYTGCRTASQ